LEEAGGPSRGSPARFHARLHDSSASRSRKTGEQDQDVRRELLSWRASDPIEKNTEFRQGEERPRSARGANAQVVEKKEKADFPLLSDPTKGHGQALRAC